MHNEPVEAHGPITPERIQQGIDRLRAEGIIIENSVHNLMLPAETKNPLAAYIVEKNNFLEELARFHGKESTQEPISVEFLRWDDAYDRITSALKSGDASSAPDIVQAGHSWIVEMANQGKVADLSREIDPSEFTPSSQVGRSAFEHPGLYAIPWFMEMRLLYYNKAMIKSPDDLATWDKFLRASQSFDQREGKHFLAFPLAVTWNLLHNLAPWLWANGGDIVRAEKFGPFEIFRVAIDDRESIDAMLYLKQLTASGSVDFPSVTQEIVDREFRDGKYAAIITGPWITKILGAGWLSKFGVASLPAGPRGSFPFVGGSHLMVSEASRGRGNFERSVALIRHLTSRDAQLRFAAATGLYPANREAIDELLASDRDGMLRQAVESGLAYPAMPYWGMLVENEFIRNHVWNIWRDISQTVPDTALIGTINNAAWDLRRSIAIAGIKQAAIPAGIALAFIAALIAGFVLRERRARLWAIARCDSFSNELRRLSAERKVVEGRALIMQRRCDEGSRELTKLREELDSIQHKSAELTSQLAEARIKHPSWDKNRIGDFSIRSDGTLAFSGTEVKFDHSRQARRLIEYMTRRACSGGSDVHCLWGYPLFGWEAGKIRTEPKRLFETVTAKINSRLKSMGKPPLLERIGKGSCSWQFFWDKDSIAEQSAIKLSMREYDIAREFFADKNVKEACAHAIAALELDHKNMDAISILMQMLSLADVAVESQKTRIKRLLKNSEKLIIEEIVSLKSGITQVRAVVGIGSLPRGIDAEAARTELMAMEYQEEYLEKRFEGIFRRAAAHMRPMIIDEIASKMQEVQSEISRIMEDGASPEIVWASVVGSASFERLISIPNIRSMVHNFYNHEIQGCEDPRLVQLALVSLLSSPTVIRAANEAKDERDLLTHIDRSLRKQLVTLEQQLGSMAPM